MDRYEVIKSLVGGQISSTQDGIIYHDGQTPPSEAEIDAEVIRMEKEYSDNEYARNRENEYPSIKDVTVALAEKAEGDSTMWDKITADRSSVKAQFPKPE